MESKPDAVCKEQQICVCCPSQAIPQLNDRSVLKQIDKMTGKFIYPLTVKQGRLRELSWANKHKIHQLADGDGARGGPQG